MASGFSSGPLEWVREVQTGERFHTGLGESGFHHFVGFEDDLGHGLPRGVRDRKMGADCPEFLEELRRPAMKNHCGTATWEAPDFDIVPCDAPAPTGSDGLHGSFLGGKSSGVALCLIGFGLAVVNFVGGKYPLQKAPAKALDRGLDAIHLRNVDAGSYDHSATIPVSPTFKWVPDTSFQQGNILRIMVFVIFLEG